MTLQRAELTTDINKILILGSGSKAREDLLKKIGLTPGCVIPAKINEKQNKNEKPLAYVARMAAEKADAISIREDNILITADTIVLVGKKILHKTEDINEARKNLKLLSGRRHKVATSFCVKKGLEVKGATVQTILRMRGVFIFR